MNNKDYLKKILSANIHVEDKKLEESLNELGTPVTDKPHQQLITDENGVPKWEDRTHYAGRRTVEWNGDITGLTNIGTNIIRYCKVSDMIPTYDELMDDNITYSISDAINSVPDIKGTFDDGKAYGRFGYNGVTSAPMIVAVHDAPAHVGNIPLPEQGLYFAIGFKKYYFTSLTWGKDKQLSDNYLPANVPVIQTAEVGQTAVVKAVDENSKPTEWEAADVIKKLTFLIASYPEYGILASEKTFKEVDDFAFKNGLEGIQANLSISGLTMSSETEQHNPCFSSYSCRRVREINQDKVIAYDFTFLVNNEKRLYRLTDNGVVLLESSVIPSVAVASVGQTLVVKSIDENGKPTVWEAVDISGITEERVNELIAEAFANIPNAEEASF